MHESAPAVIQGDKMSPVGIFQDMLAHVDDAANLMKMLANAVRLLILCHLVDGELSVGAINRRVGISQSALSQHLALLRRDGLVRTRREAQSVYYSIKSEKVRRILILLYELYCSPSMRSSGH